MNTIIRPITGPCKECSENRGTQPLIAGLCQKHYWLSRQKVKSTQKPKDPYATTRKPSAIEQGGGKKARKPIPPHSEKGSRKTAAYLALRKVWMESHTRCEADMPGCTEAATECHHQQGRIGELMLDSTKWLAVCHSCHEKITAMNIDEAVSRGFSLYRNRLNA